MSRGKGERLGSFAVLNAKREDPPMVEITEPTTFNGRRTPRDHLARAVKLVPYARYFPKHPALLVGAAVVGVLGVLAWRNREKIAQTAGPMLDAASERGLALKDNLKERLPFGRSEAGPV